MILVVHILWRRRAVDIGLVVLALLASQIVRDALAPRATASPGRPPVTATRTEPKALAAPAVRRPVTLPPTAEQVALAADGTVLLWAAGGRQCGPVVAARSSDGGRSFTAVRLPLARVDALDLGGPTAVALGRDAQCRPAAATSHDGGMTWTLVPGVDAHGVAVAEPGVVWLLRRAAPPETVDATTLRVRRTPASPCLHERVAPIPAYVAVARDVVTVLCRGRTGAGGEVRLLYRSTDAGRRWTQVAGARRPGRYAGRPDGLDGDGQVRALLPGAVLVDGVRCAAGELRRSTNGGRTWQVVPCLAGVTRVLAVADGGWIAVRRTSGMAGFGHYA